MIINNQLNNIRMKIKYYWKNKKQNNYKNYNNNNNYFYNVLKRF